MSSHGAETLIFDLPLGGKPKIAKRCVGDSLSVKALCWLSPPFIPPTGHKLGTVLVPGADKRPMWASSSVFNFTIAADGTLEKLEVSEPSHERRGEIATSIRSRFGLPQTVTNVPESQIHAAQWVAKDAVVDLLCAPETGCKVTFSTPEAEAGRLAEVAARQKEKGRAVGP